MFVAIKLAPRSMIMHNIYAVFINCGKKLFKDLHLIH